MRGIIKPYPGDGDQQSQNIEETVRALSIRTYKHPCYPKSNESETVKSVRAELRVSIPNCWADVGNTCFGNRKSSFARSA